MFVNFNMYKFILMLLFAYCFAETVEVYYQADTPIAGLQFMVWGNTTISASCPETCGTVGKSTICIEDIIVSNSSGNDLQFQAGKCWIP